MPTATTPQGTQLGTTEIALTERQANFLSLADEGKSHHEIAEIYEVSVRTVSSVLFGVRNRAISSVSGGERPLTARQLEILCLMGAGLCDAEIAGRLYLSQRTIETHIRDARERLGARTRVQCVMLAVSQELLILDHDGQLLVPHAHRVAA